MNSDGLIVFLFIIIVFGAIVAGCIYDSRKERDNERNEPKDYSDTPHITKGTTSTSTRSTTSTATKSTTSTSTRSTTSTATRSTTNYARNIIEKDSTSKSSQKTIYAFRGKQSIHLCPFCDGENELGAKICNICRRDL